jgi:hypothetical protein
VQDFAWWSVLTAADARLATEMAKARLAQEVIDGQTYWLGPSSPALPTSSPGAYLLPSFDEYTVAYRDRSAVLDMGHSSTCPPSCDNWQALLQSPRCHV